MINMKKISVFALFTIMTTGAYATQWWNQPTICKMNPSRCYVQMGVGYETEMWDASAGCWGVKLICPDALKNTNSRVPVAMGKSDIATRVNADYDVDALNGDCFGVRRVQTGNATATVNGTNVNIWCAGILPSPDEEIPGYGEITYGTQPTCATLAHDGYAAIMNGKCHGKYYDPSDYYIECGAATTPNRIIILNGAEYDANARDASMTRTDANRIFDSMYSVSHTQHEKYFNVE